MSASEIRRENAPSSPMGWMEAFMISAVAVVLCVPVTVGLYLVKSALGINLMTEPSLFHDLFYHLVS